MNPRGAHNNGILAKPTEFEPSQEEKGIYPLREKGKALGDRGKEKGKWNLFPYLARELIRQSQPRARTRDTKPNDFPVAGAALIPPTSDERNATDLLVFPSSGPYH